jgi:hypothetical protein
LFSFSSNFDDVSVGVVEARIRIGWGIGDLKGGIHIINEQGIVNRGSRTFFVKGLIIDDTVSFFDQGEFLRRVVSYRGNLVREMRPIRFFLERGVMLDFSVGAVF